MLLGVLHLIPQRKSLAVFKDDDKAIQAIRNAIRVDSVTPDFQAGFKMQTTDDVRRVAGQILEDLPKKNREALTW